MNTQNTNITKRQRSTATGTAELRGKVKSDFPKHTLEQALKVAQALTDKNGGRPLPPTETAIAVGISPGSSEFRVLLSSSIKYGLTSGSYNSETVSVEEGGRNIVEPRTAEDRRKALAQASLKPETFRRIFDYFRGKKLPDDMFFQNTLVREFEVPREHAAKCAAVFSKNMEWVGLIRAASTGKWLTTDPGFVSSNGSTSAEKTDPAEVPDVGAVELPPMSIERERPALQAIVDKRLTRVFITHGKNTAFIAPIKDLLSFGQLEPVVAIERESVAKPVPEKVLSEMRTCGAAIIHIEHESKTGEDGKQQPILNSNVLIEVGAAMALYGQRYIFLVKEGVELPSNLRGLYEVRYAGDKLDAEDSIRLLKAFNALKKEPLPAASAFNEEGK